MKKGPPRKPPKAPGEKGFALPRQPAMLQERSSLSHVIRFAETFPNAEIISAVLNQLFCLESAILRDIERFLLKLGAGFAFVERQKRISLDDKDYYIDLLFFHRRMRRLIAIQLEIGEFKPAASRQVEIYLRWLNQHERHPSEKAPFGIVLHAGNNCETAEYLDVDARGIYVPASASELPPREMLEERLRRAMEGARNRLALG